MNTEQMIEAAWLREYPRASAEQRKMTPREFHYSVDEMQQAFESGYRAAIADVVKELRWQHAVTGNDIWLAMADAFERGEWSDDEKRA